MATRSTCAAIRRATTSPSTASATAPSTAAPIRSTCSRSKSTTAPIRCSTARAASAARSTSSPRSRRTRISTILSAAVGTDDYYRGDGRHQPAGQRLHRGPAQRDVPPQRRARPRLRGIRALGRRAGDHLRHRRPTSLTLAYVHQHDDNIPIYGVPFFLNQLNDGPLPEADDSDYFGYRNLDEQDIRLDRLTATFRHEFSDDIFDPQPHPLAARRPVQPDQRAAGHLLPRRHRPPAGLRRAERRDRPALHGGLTNVTTGNGPASAPSTSPSRPASGSPPARAAWSRDQRTSCSTTRPTCAATAGEAGGLRNMLVVGASLTWEDYAIETALAARATPPARRPAAARKHRQSDSASIPGRSTIPSPPARAATPEPAPSTPSTRSRSAGCSSSTAASGWSAPKAGFRTVPLAFYPPGTAALDRAAAAAADAARRRSSPIALGAVFKPTPQRSLYVAYGNARTPTSATVRLGCGSASRRPAPPTPARPPRRPRAITRSAPRPTCSAAGCSSPRPCSATSAAISGCPRTIRRSPTLQVVDGRSRVDGLALGASGNITPRMDDLRQLHLSRRRGAAERLRLLPRQSGAAGCRNSAAIPDPQARRPADPDAAAIRAACSPPTACRSGSSSATASPIRAASRPTSATCCSGPNISPTIA